MQDHPCQQAYITVSVFSCRLCPWPPCCDQQTQTLDPSVLHRLAAEEQEKYRLAFRVDPKSALNNFVKDQYLEPSAFINAQWLRAWFLGQPIDELDSAVTIIGSKASKADAIDLIGDGGPDEVATAIELSKQIEAEKEAARKKDQEALEAVMRASAAESPDTIMTGAAAAGADAAAQEHSDMQGVVTESPVQRAASAASALDDAAAAVGAPPADDAPAASSSAAAAAAAAEAAGASTVATAAPPAARPPPPLRHPLWPGDLGEAQQSILCKHGRPDPRNPDLKRINVEAWITLADDNAVQKTILLKERDANQLAARSSSIGATEPLLVAAASAAADPSAAFISCKDLCVECCADLHSAEEQAEQDLVLRNSLLSDILDSKVDSKNAVWQTDVSLDSAMYVSKLFLNKWKTKAQQEAIYEKCTQRSDTININEGIMCGHKALGVEEARHRVVVPKVSQATKDQRAAQHAIALHCIASHCTIIVLSRLYCV